VTNSVGEGVVLKPCPFCGGADEQLVQTFTRAADTFAYWSVECLGCGCEIASDASQAEADEQWNTRLSAPPATSDRGEGLDWLAIAKLAGEHGVRYRTNRALTDFMTAATPLFAAPVSVPQEGVREALDRPALLAAARAWWSAKMPATICQSVVIKGDGRVDVYWRDAEESGKYTLPVDFTSTATPTPTSAPSVGAEGTLRDAAEKARAQFQFYADEHGRAGKYDKARTNAGFAEMLETALFCVPASSEGDAGERGPMGWDLPASPSTNGGETAAPVKAWGDRECSSCTLPRRDCECN
jgi:Lar family restriction alleviation protein